MSTVIFLNLLQHDRANYDSSTPLTIIARKKINIIITITIILLSHAERLRTMISITGNKSSVQICLDSRIV